MSKKNFIINTKNLELSQDSTLENIAGQLQKNSDKLLCVINGKKIHFFSKNENFPNVEFIRSHDVNNIVEYYFSDSHNNKYCVFGSDMARIFSKNENENYGKLSNPSLENSEGGKKNNRFYNFNSQFNKLEDSKKIIRRVEKDKIVTISDSGKVITLPFNTSKVEIIKYEL